MPENRPPAGISTGAAWISARRSCGSASHISKATCARRHLPRAGSAPDATLEFLSMSRSRRACRIRWSSTGGPIAGRAALPSILPAANWLPLAATDKSIEVRQHLEIVCQRQGAWRTVWSAHRRSRCYGAPPFRSRGVRSQRQPGSLENALLSIASYLGQLVNTLDPAMLVIGGGIGGNPAINSRLATLTRPFIFADPGAGPADCSRNVRRQCLCDRHRCLGQQGRRASRRA